MLDGATPVTITLVVTGFAVASVTVGVTLWLVNRFQKLSQSFAAGIEQLERDMLAALSNARREGGERLEALEERMARLGDKQSRYEAYAEKHFLSKDSFGAIFSRFERSMESLGDRLEARLMRIESHFLPGFQVAPMKRPRRDEKRAESGVSEEP